MCVTQLDNLGALFFFDTCNGTSPSEAALYASSFPGGLLLSVLGPAQWYAVRAVSARQKRLVCCSLQAFSCTACICMTLISGQTTGSWWIAAKILGNGCVAFGLGVAYYIPLHAVSVQIGGTHDAGMLNSVIDGAGYIFAVVFQLGSGAVLDNDKSRTDNSDGLRNEGVARGWTGVWIMLTCMNMLSLVFMFRFFALTLIKWEDEETNVAGASEVGAWSSIHHFQRSGTGAYNALQEDATAVHQTDNSDSIELL